MLILLVSVETGHTSAEPRACTQDFLLNQRGLGAAPPAEVSTGVDC